MTIEVIPLFNESLKVAPKSSARLPYRVTGSEDTGSVVTAIQGALTAYYRGLKFADFDLEHIGGGTWDLVANYAFQASDSEPQFAFDTTGGTAHITQAKEEIGSYTTSGRTPPTFNGAIGVTKDSVDGCEIVLPVYRFSETCVFDPGVVDAAFKATVFYLTGRVNNASFKGFAAGECLFEGARGLQRGNGDCEVTFNYSGSPNLTGLTVGDITGIDKEGHHYLWVRYQDFNDSSFNGLVKRPVAVVVNRVYEYGDMSLLGVGG